MEQRRGKKRQTEEPAAPMCQIVGCKRNLTGYFQKRRVCDFHFKISSVELDGVEQRFCQQCTRFQDVANFDGDKRSCRNSLAKHNSRRRKSGPVTPVNAGAGAAVYGYPVVGPAELPLLSGAVYGYPVGPAELDLNVPPLSAAAAPPILDLHFSAAAAAPIVNAAPSNFSAAAPWNFSAGNFNAAAPSNFSAAAAADAAPTLELDAPWNLQLLSATAAAAAPTDTLPLLTNAGAAADAIYDGYPVGLAEDFDAWLSTDASTGTPLDLDVMSAAAAAAADTLVDLEGAAAAKASATAESSAAAAAAAAPDPLDAETAEAKVEYELALQCMRQQDFQAADAHLVAALECNVKWMDDLLTKARFFCQISLRLRRGES